MNVVILVFLSFSRHKDIVDIILLLVFYALAAAALASRSIRRGGKGKK